MKVNPNAEMDCCGCGVCFAVCPVGAIKKIEKERGNIYYEIGDGCINCGECIKVCPLTSNIYHSEQDFFERAISKNRMVLKKSSSGGIAFHLSSMVIRGGGVVYGAGWNVSTQAVQHKRVDTINGLLELQGSKYVQSVIKKEVYLNILEDLKKRQVLFVGTPCQISAIRLYTKEHPNLLSIDLICHGVPSGKLFSDQLNRLVKHPVKFVSFREGLNFKLTIKCANKSYVKQGLDNPFYSLYLNFASLRESCYSCRFACNKRLGDITLGDYVEENIGFSCVIINTENGKKLVNKSSDIIEYLDRDIKLLNNNLAYNMPTTKHSKTDKFTQLYDKHGLYFAYYSCFWGFFFKRVARKILGNRIYNLIVKGIIDK